LIPSGSGDLIPYLLLSLLGTVLMAGIFCVMLVLHWTRSRKVERRQSRDRGVKSATLEVARAFRALVFEPPRTWLAIRGHDPQTVQRALGLHNPKPCSWEGGLSHVHDHKLFISPPVSGWVLVVGHGLPDPADDVDECYRFVVNLSRRVGQVQFYGVHRVVNHHCWVKAEHGSILRAYAWAGRTLWNQGDLTAAEADLGLHCFDYCEGEISGIAASESCRSNTDKVLLLAARWSVDPTAIDAGNVAESLGITGELLPSRTH
jgi:hypothetical protein